MPLCVEDRDENTTEIEKQRARNVALLSVELSKLKATADAFYKELEEEEAAKKAKSNKRKRANSENVYFPSVKKCSSFDLPRRRSIRNLGKESKSYADMLQLEEDERQKEHQALKTKFPFAAKLQAHGSSSNFNTQNKHDFLNTVNLEAMDLSDTEDVEYLDEVDVYSERHIKQQMKIVKIFKDYRPPLAVADVSDAMIRGITYKSTDKLYDKELGSSCHQCRQKTLDTKSVCRWPLCRGVRGQFCGFCLDKRYGENLEVALKDENWVCPVCKGLCNCSICRNKAGLAPTGILAPLVEEEGFNSVQDYLGEKEGVPSNMNDFIAYFTPAFDPKNKMFTTTKSHPTLTKLSQNKYILEGSLNSKQNTENDLSWEEFNAKHFNEKDLEDEESDVQVLQEIPKPKIEGLDIASILKYAVDNIDLFYIDDDAVTTCTKSDSLGNTELPEVQQDSPEVQQDSPEVQQDSPEVQQDSPEVQQDSPEVQQDSPEVQQDLPELIHCDLQSKSSGSEADMSDVSETSGSEADMSDVSEMSSICETTELQLQDLLLEVEESQDFQGFESEEEEKEEKKIEESQDFQGFVSEEEEKEEEEEEEQRSQDFQGFGSEKENLSLNAEFNDLIKSDV